MKHHVKSRLNKLRQKMDHYNIEWLLVKSAENRRYFSGFKALDTQINESSGALLIGHDNAILLTDSRYTLEAKQQAPNYEIITYYAGLAKELSTIKELQKAKNIYYEDVYLSVAEYNRIKLELPGKQLEPLPFDLTYERSIKSTDEINLIKQALAITEESVYELWEYLEVGKTEKQAAIFLENAFRSKGADSTSFDTIIASGLHAAMPHAMPGSKPIKQQETILIDCGAKYDGYCADISRVKIIGEATAWQKEIYSIVQDAQNKAIENIKAGAIASEIDKIARDHIAKAGYGEYFGHSLGHGVGLAIHEYPNLSPKSNLILQAGEIITVEPGIYLPDKGGVRLEQMVLVTDSGCSVLNKNSNFYYFN